ncbi:MAG TPA: glycosyltransferase [Polyangia bacterium]|nr:glycosyltransferase [Polyangia bacterium]
MGLSVVKRRILYLISTLLQGGAQRHLLELIRFLDPNQFEVAICALNGENHFGADLPAGQPAYQLGSPVFWNPLAFVRLTAALRDFRPDILHCYMNDGNLWGRLASRIHRPRAVLTSVHLDDMSPIHRFWERRLHGFTDRIVAHSRSIEHLLVNDLGVPAAKVTVIANGVDVGRFTLASDETRRRARQARALTDDTLVAVMPARIAEQKNQDLVLEALGRLKGQGKLPAGFQLLLAGNISSHALARKVNQLIERYDLGAQVQQLGPVKDMPALFAASDVAFLPSRTEASPIAALEALSAGIPVLISDTSNTDGVVVPGQHGWQVKANDLTDLERAIETILATSAAERTALGRAGRAHVEARFTNRRVADDFTRLYDAVAP